MNMIPDWWPNKEPIYDIHKSYEDNFAQGPIFDGEIPERKMPPKEKWIDFLGFKVASPLGVPAGPLLNSDWTTLSARLGFDIVTYKTIRSGTHPCHPAPNMIYVETKGELNKKRLGEILYQKENKPGRMSELAVTNSFGVPSMGPMYLLEDIERANKSLAEGQIMIVSAMGSHGKGDFIEDYARSAALAKEAGAKIIEINFSCPNVTTGEGAIYTDPDTVYTISKRVVKEIKDTPLIIKVGYFTNLEKLKQTMQAAARAGVRAICGINTIGMKVANKQGDSALGPNRFQSGVCGSPIRRAGIEFVKYATAINEAEKFGLEIIGVGGVTLPQHFDELLNSGAKVVMSATGMMWDPYLAMRWHYGKV